MRRRWSTWHLLLGIAALVLAGTPSGTAEAARKYPFRSSAGAGKAASKRPAARPPRATPAPSELEEEDEPPPPPSRRRGPATSEADKSEDDEPDQKEERRPQRRARRDSEGDDEDEDDGAADAPMTSLPSIIPRLVSGFLGLSVTGRSFETGPTLQRESALGRAGPAVSLEAYPLLRFTRGRMKKLGIAIAYSMEFGVASAQYTNGSTVSFSVRQSRWMADVRYAFTPASRVVLIPMLGLGVSSYDLHRPMQPMPSGCVRAADTLPCLPDSVLTHFKLGLETRIAVNAAVAVSLGLNVLPVLNVGKSAGQSGAEAVDVQSLGYGGELGLTWALDSWIDLRASIPIVRFGQKFSGNMVMGTYPTGTETYYGTMLGVVAHSL